MAKRTLGPQLVLEDLHGRKSDGSIVVLADDVTKLMILESGLACDAVEMVAVHDEKYDKKMLTAGYVLNHSKRALVPHLRGRGQNRTLEEAMPQGVVAPNARHLDGRVTWNGSNCQELHFRVAAMTRGWKELGRFLVCAKSDGNKEDGFHRPRSGGRCLWTHELYFQREGVPCARFFWTRMASCLTTHRELDTR